jgi:hypothetical protein
VSEGWSPGVRMEASGQLVAEGIVRHREIGCVGVLSNDGWTLQMRREGGVGIARQRGPSGGRCGLPAKEVAMTIGTGSHRDPGNAEGKQRWNSEARSAGCGFRRWLARAPG